ncbi:MAG TPA: LuxR C-terminal-related transcriptional regulator, partial [Candidatus Dormibacteraeota bacterium]|nr:LuxR C-terminal-related transcriptional regulator [Candidatus Dormibacteraeota bacterium]
KAAQDASRIAEQLGDGDMLARAALVVRGVAGPGASNPIKELCEIALRNPPENPALRVQLLSQIVVASMWLPTADGIARAQELSGEAMRLADKAVDPDVVFAAIHARQMAMSGPDGVDERLHLAQRALELSTRSGRKWFEQWGHSWKADALSQLGRMSEAEGELSQLRRLADELREPRLLWRTLLAESSLALLRGRFADARRLSDDALAVGVKSQRPMAEFSHAMHHAVLTAFIGPDRAAWPAPAEDSPVSDPALRFNRAFALAQTGRNEEARLALREFVDALHAGLRWFAVLPVMSQLAQAVAAVDDAELAAILYADLTPYAAYNVAIGAGFGGFWGSVARFLGMLATTLERWDEAAEHFERAISFETEMGAPPFVACSQILYAEMLVRRGGPEDVRRARGLASAALTAGTAMGMKPWIERARALVSRLEARRIVSHPLSRRELEIARLVAEGLTNRTIAEKLHISERTAESHVKNICDKLGFNSRAQVAAWVSAQRPAG